MKITGKIIFLIFIQYSILSFQSFSQTAPWIQWQNTIGGSDEDGHATIQQTSDGGYILGGHSKSNISGDKSEYNRDTICIPDCTADYWIVKTDSAGNIQWQKTIGGSADDGLWSMQQTSDGGYILGGYSNSNISGDKTENSMGGGDYWIVKTDSAGNIQWQNTIGGSDEDVLRSIRQTVDGGYILGGGSRSNISGDKTENTLDTIMNTADYWIVKTDSVGNIQWQNTIGGSNADWLQFQSIQQTVDSGFIIGGSSQSNISGDKTENNRDTTLITPDYWIVKTDSLGNIQWQNTIGGSAADFLCSIQQTAEGGYILGGYSNSNISGDKTENCIGGYDYWIVKTDTAGNIQWQNTIGGNDEDALYSIQQTDDGEYVMGGLSYSSISGDKTQNCNGHYDYWIVKTGFAGDIQWQSTIGGSEADGLSSIRQTNDGGYILGGASLSNISGDKTENCMGSFDYWVIKLFPDTITGIHNLQSSFFNLYFFPNPLTTQSKLTFKNPNKDKFHFTLYDITGRMTESVSTTNDEIIITKGNKQAGVYFFNLANKRTEERWNGKFLITK